MSDHIIVVTGSLRHFVYSSVYSCHLFLISCVSVAAAAAKSLQLCPTLCNPIDGSPPGSSIPGILQARTLEWVAISFSNAGKWKVKVKSLSSVWLLLNPWTAAYQAPPSMAFSRQEYWSGVPLPSPKVHIISVFYCAHLCMKYSLGSSNFPEEISRVFPILLFSSHLRRLSCLFLLRPVICRLCGPLDKFLVNSA